MCLSEWVNSDERKRQIENARMRERERDRVKLESRRAGYRATTLKIYLLDSSYNDAGIQGRLKFSDPKNFESSYKPDSSY